MRDRALDQPCKALRRGFTRGDHLGVAELRAVDPSRKVRDALSEIDFDHTPGIDFLSHLRSRKRTSPIAPHITATTKKNFECVQTGHFTPIVPTR